MSKTLFDALGIDESEAIDDDEIKRIKLLISKIKVNAANVARENDTDDTVAILDIIQEVVKRLSKHKRFEVEQFWNAIRQGQVPQQGLDPASAALSAGNTPATSQVPADYEQAKADATALIEFLKGLTSKNVVDNFDFGNPRQREFVINELVQMHEYADKYKRSQGGSQSQGQPQTSPSQADLNAANRRIQELETALATAKTAVNAADTLLSKADAVVAPRGGWTFVDGRKSVKVPPNGWLYNDDTAGKLVEAIESAKETLGKY